MDGNNIFIPAIAVLRQRRPPGGKPFWDGFWKDFRDSTAYDNRKTRLVREIEPIVQTNLPADADLYAEVTYGDGASSKSNRPSQIWSESTLQVVESTDDKTFTVSGKKEDFEKLDTILQSSSFEKAKAPSGQRNPGKTTSREVYAISSIKSKNLGLNDRIDPLIGDKISMNSPDVIECIVELHQNVLPTRYDVIYDALRSQLVGNSSETIANEKIQKRGQYALFNNLSYIAKLTINDIRTLLENEEFNYIRVIRTAPNFSAQRSIFNFDISEATISNPITNEIIAIFDSGVAYPPISSNRFRVNHEKFLKSHRQEDTDHGTFVTSRALFGEDIERLVRREIDTLTPVGKYLDAQVLYYDPASNETNSDSDELLKALDEISSRYPQIKIYNFSIANTNPLDEEHPSELSERIDQLAREKDVLFICVTGNNDVYRMVNYDELFGRFSNSTMILSPADTAANIVVGSSAAKVDNEAAANIQNAPSPFTRTGIVRESVRKPDLVANGGNYLSASVTQGLPDPQQERAHTTSLQRYSVAGIGKDSRPRGDFGTSFSAPLVSRQAALCLNWIKGTNLASKLSCNGNYANLVKTLLVHSTGGQELPRGLDENQQRAFGYGIAEFSRLSSASDDEVTILYCDELDGLTKKHKLLFELPDFVTNGDMEFTFTLCYSPPVNRNYKKYTMLDVTGTLRVPYPGLDKDGQPTTKYSSISPDSTWTNNQSNYSGINHFTKRKRRGIRTNFVEILVQMLAFEEYENTFSDKQDMKQSYSLALTIKDLGANGRLKQELLQKSQIEVLNQTRVQVDV